MVHQQQVCNVAQVRLVVDDVLWWFPFLLNLLDLGPFRAHHIEAAVVLVVLLSSLSVAFTLLQVVLQLHLQSLFTLLHGVLLVDLDFSLELLCGVVRVFLEEVDLFN